MATRPRLLCRGAPSACSFLNGTWTLDPAEALVNGHPHFVHEGLHLYRTADGTWVVAPEVGAGLVYLMAASNGSHPNNRTWGTTRFKYWTRRIRFMRMDYI